MRGIRNVNAAKFLDFPNGQTLEVDIDKLRNALGKNVTIRTLETRINNFLVGKSPDPAVRQFVHLYSLNPIDFAIMECQVANLVNGLPDNPDWWVREPEA